MKIDNILRIMDETTQAIEHYNRKLTNSNLSKNERKEIKQRLKKCKWIEKHLIPKGVK